MAFSLSWMFGTAHAVETTVAGVRGGKVGVLLFDPKNPNNVYAAGQGGGLFKSTDKGDSWSGIFLEPIAEHSIQSLLISSRTTNSVVIAGEQGGEGPVLQRSIDGGAFTTVLTNELQGCYALTEGVIGNATFYAGIYTESDGNPLTSHIYKSKDAGVTWTALAVSTEGALITDIIQIPLSATAGRLIVGTRLENANNGGTLFAGGILYSDDEGATWTTAATGPGVLNFAYNGDEGNPVIVAATIDGSNVHISTSSDGITWTTAESYPSNSWVASFNSFNAVRFSPNDGRFYAQFGISPLGGGTASALVQSGAAPTYTWPADASTNLEDGLINPVNLLGSNGLPSFAIDPTDEDLILAGSQGGVGIFKTTDGGSNWDRSNIGLNAARIDFAQKYRPSNYLYAADDSGFFYFSSGDVDDFTLVFRSSGVGGNAIAADYMDPKRVYLDAFKAGVNEQLWFNPDATAASDDFLMDHTGWQVRPYPTGGNSGADAIRALLVDGSTVYAGIAPNDNLIPGIYLYKSVDDGANWNDIVTDLSVCGVRSLAFDPSDHTILYAGAGDYTNNGGSNHIPSCAGGIWKSVDAGVHWTQLNSNAELNDATPLTIAIDSTTPSRVWLFTVNEIEEANLWESIDSGASWTKITPTLDDSEDLVQSIAYVSSENRLITAVNSDIYSQIPGSGSTTWEQVFSVYGEVITLFNGSAGVASGSGLYLAVGFGDDDDDTAPLVTSVGAAGATISYNPSAGPVSVVIPPGAFSQTLNVTLSVPSSFPATTLGAGNLTGLGVGLDITLDQAVQPTTGVSLTISYQDANVSGLDENKLIIARYDTTAGVWVPLDSTVNAAGNNVTATTNHFSTFQIMTSAAPRSLGGAKAFPNPFRPALGHTAMTFALFPEDSRIRIYDVRGSLIRDFSADATGMASWDGRNQSGQNVASGVYFIYAQGAGDHRTFKVIVQR